MKSKRKDNEEKDDNRSQPSAREILMKAGRKRSTSKKDKILGKKTEVKKMDSGSDKDSSESKSSRPGRRKSAPDQKEGRAARSTESTRGRGSKTDKPDRNSGRTGRGTRDSKKGKKIRSASSQEPSQRVKQADYLREEIRLNKYIAHAGLCSRREADEYIEQGKVKVWCRGYGTG